MPPLVSIALFCVFLGIFLEGAHGDDGHEGVLVRRTRWFGQLGDCRGRSQAYPCTENNSTGLNS
jgi:hypothetical protein